MKYMKHALHPAATSTSPLLPAPPLVAPENVPNPPEEEDSVGEKEEEAEMFEV